MTRMPDRTSQGTPEPDPFEDDLRAALDREAGGPAPERLVQRVAAMRRDPASRPVTARVLARVGPRGGPRLTFGFGLLAVAVAVVAVALSLRGFGQVTGPQAGGPSASSGSPGPTTVASATAAPNPTASAGVEPSPTASSGTLGGPIPPGFEPVSVTFVSADQGWLLGSATCAGGSCAAVLRTSDGGRTWASIPAPDAQVSAGALPPAAGGINRLRFADPLDGWAFSGELWATHDGGATWHRVTLPGTTSSGLRIMALEAASGLVHVAYYDTANAGTTISVATSPANADSWSVSPVQIGFGAGPVPQTQLVLHGPAGWLLQVDRTVVGGARLSAGAWKAWQPPCADANGPAILAASSAVQLVAACDIGVWATPQGVHLFTSSDGGVTFQEAATKVPVTDLQGATAAPGPATIVIAGTLPSGGAAGLVTSFDGGATWTTTYRASSVSSIAELGFTTQQQGVAIVTSGTAGQLVMTRDGGHTWTPVVLAGS